MARASRIHRILGRSPRIFKKRFLTSTCYWGSVWAFQNNHEYWADALADYEAIGILDRLETPEWEALMAIDDPFEYLDRLTLPKFIINASSDEFFLPDSSQFYFDELKGVKYLSYVPNAGHGLDPWSYVEANYHAVLNSADLPQFTWTQETENTIKVTTSTIPTIVKLWQATNPTDRNFRLDTVGSSAWTSTTLASQGGGVYTGTVTTPGSGYRAYFVEMTYPGTGKKSFQFTTHVKVVPDTYPATWPPTE